MLFKIFWNHVSNFPLQKAVWSRKQRFKRLSGSGRELSTAQLFGLNGLVLFCSSQKTAGSRGLNFEWFMNRYEPGWFMKQPPRSSGFMVQFVAQPQTTNGTTKMHFVPIPILSLSKKWPVHVCHGDNETLGHSQQCSFSMDVESPQTTNLGVFNTSTNSGRKMFGQQSGKYSKEYQSRSTLSVLKTYSQNPH